MKDSEKRSAPETGSGNGKQSERRIGVDRRITDTPDFEGPERRRRPRRKPDHQPDKPIKR